MFYNIHVTRGILRARWFLGEEVLCMDKRTSKTIRRPVRRHVDDGIDYDSDTYSEAYSQAIYGGLDEHKAHSHAQTCEDNSINDPAEFCD